MAPASPPASSSSTTWPYLLPLGAPLKSTLRGLASSTPGLEPTPRRLLFVIAKYTRPLTGLRSVSSGRSIFVAPTASAAPRVLMSTSATLKPGTMLRPLRTNGSHWPVPSNSRSSGSWPKVAGSL